MLHFCELYILLSLFLSLNVYFTVEIICCDIHGVSLVDRLWHKTLLRCRREHTGIKADTHEGFCSRSMLQAHFARVSTHEHFQVRSIFNLLNIVEHFAGWKFCSQGWSTPMKSLVHTEELCSRSMLREQNPSCVSTLRICLPFYISTSYYCTDPGLQLGDRAPLNYLPLWTCWYFIVLLQPVNKSFVRWK